MRDEPTYRAGRWGSVAAMLLAALALVLHGAVPVMAHAPDLARPGLAMAAKHTDCAGHHGPAGHAAAAGDEHAGVQADSARPAKADGQEPASVPRRTDCCSTAAAGVLPIPLSAVLPALPIARGVAPRASAVLEGAAPEGPSEPPRTTDQV